MAYIIDKMKYSEMKGTHGFVFFWTLLVIFSTMSIIWDWKISVLGMLVSICLGFLGFDMFGDLFNIIKKKKESKK